MTDHPALTTESPAVIDVGVPIEHRWIDTGGATLHVALAGPEDGPLVVLLHGFPEAWFGWVHQIGPLANAGFRVAAPDQRGYNLSEKPGALDAYRIDYLAEDIVGLARELTKKPWCVVGHDWGGAVAWRLASVPPDGLAGMAALNIPELGVMRSHLLRPRQAARSWYMGAMQLPMLPEWWLARDACAALTQALVGSSKPGTFDDAHLAHYRQAWQRPGAIGGMLNWYRAGARRRPPAPAPGPIEVPVCIIWGERDPFLGAEMVDPSAAQCRDAQVVRLPGITHWVQHEAPDEVNETLRDFATRVLG